MKINETEQMGPLVTRRDWLDRLAGLGAGVAALGSIGEVFAAEAAAPAEGPIQPKDFAHLAFVVKDMDAWVSRYAGMFGVSAPKVIVTGARDKAHTTYRGAPTDARAKLAFLKLGAAALELIEPDANPSTWREWLDKKGEGMHHLGFNVADLDKALTWLKGKGCDVVQTGDFTGGSYVYADTSRILGCVLELLVKK